MTMRYLSIQLLNLKIIQYQIPVEFCIFGHY